MTTLLQQKIAQKQGLLASWQQELQTNDNGLQKYAQRAIDVLNDNITDMQKELDSFNKDSNE